MSLTIDELKEYLKLLTGFEFKDDGANFLATDDLPPNTKLRYLTTNNEGDTPVQQALKTCIDSKEPQQGNGKIKFSFDLEKFRKFYPVDTNVQQSSQVITPVENEEEIDYEIEEDEEDEASEYEDSEEDDDEANERKLLRGRASILQNYLNDVSRVSWTQVEEKYEFFVFFSDQVKAHILKTSLNQCKSGNDNIIELKAENGEFKLVLKENDIYLIPEIIKFKMKEVDLLQLEAIYKKIGPEVFKIAINIQVGPNGGITALQWLLENNYLDKGEGDQRIQYKNVLKKDKEEGILKLNDLNTRKKIVHFLIATGADFDLLEKEQKDEAIAEEQKLKTGFARKHLVQKGPAEFLKGLKTSSGTYIPQRAQVDESARLRKHKRKSAKNINSSVQVKQISNQPLNVESRKKAKHVLSDSSTVSADSKDNPSKETPLAKPPKHRRNASDPQTMSQQRKVAKISSTNSGLAPTSAASSSSSESAGRPLSKLSFLKPTKEAPESDTDMGLPPKP